MIEVCEYRGLVRERVKRRKRGIDGDALFFVVFFLSGRSLCVPHSKKKKKKKECGLACCSVSERAAAGQSHDFAKLVATVGLGGLRS